MIALTQTHILLYPESVLALFQDKEIQEKAEELGRFFFSNGSVTVNLLPIITFTFLGALRR